MAKRLICVIISVLMIVSLLPTTAFATYYTGSTPEIAEAIPVTVAEVVDEALTVDYVEDEDEVDLGDEDYYGIMLLAEEADTTESFVAKIGDTTYSTLTAAINAATAGDTIVLGGDVSETIGISTGKDVTIDLAGHTISSAEGSTTRLITMRGGKLTITDSVGNGTITSGAGDAVILIAGGTLIVNGGTISATGTIPAIVNAWQSSNYANEASTIVVNGGKVTAAGAPAIRNNAAGCSITVNGGEIVGYSGSTGYYIVDSVSEEDSKSVVITGGYFTTNDTSKSQVLFYQKNSGNIVVSGGYFNNAITWINSAMRAAGYSNTVLDTAKTYNNVDYKYTVASSTVFYGTISEDENGEEVITYLGSDSTPQKAVNALKSAGLAEGTTMYIELAADVTSTVDVGTGTGTSVVLELNGHNISAGSDAAIVVQDGVTLTVRDSEGTSEVSSSYSNGTVRNRGGVLKIEGGTYTNTSGCVLQNNGSNEATDETYVTTITGGTFTGTFSVVKGSVTAYAGITNSEGATTYYPTLNKAVSAASSGDTVTLYSDVKLDSSIVISGKSITLDLNGCSVERGESATSYLIGVASTASLTVIDSGEGGVIYSSNIPVDETASSYYAGYPILNEGTVIIKSGTLNGYYGIIQNSGTTTVTGGVISGTNRALGIQGGTASVTGGTVSGTSYGVIITAGTVTISGGTVSGFYDGVYATGTTASLVVNEGANISSTCASSSKSSYTSTGAIDIAYGASATINGGTIVGGYAGIAVWGGYESQSTKLVVNNGTISAFGLGVTTNGTNYYTDITVNGGSITGAYGMYLPAMESITTINGGVITGTGTGIELRAGTLIVTGGTITGQGTPESTEANGNGTTVYGAGIAVSQHTTKQEITVLITGGTITGYTGLYEINYNADTSTAGNVSITISPSTDDSNGPTIKATGANASAVYSASLDSSSTVGYSNSLTAVSISASTYNTDVSAYCVEGYTPTTNTDGTYTVAADTITLGSSANDNTAVEGVVISESAGVLVVKASGSSYNTTAYPTTTRSYSSNGYIFAGWYTDSACTTACPGVPSGTAYAKFVDANTMSIKGVVMNSVTSGDATGTKYWRIVTGLDSLNYDAIGFEIYMGTSTDMTTISGYYWGDYTATTANRKFTASEFGTCSQYISVCLVSEAASATSCKVRAYWTTLDGTMVYGAWYSCTYTSGTYELSVAVSN
ncbi:MAG: hypothetical protein LUH18_06055 [Oscillospiraceae bacterium]|nr:hypothetical protein [Oscillospiraceae bacterium]